MTRRASPRRGVLIVLEGIDGAGKSTLQRHLARRWRAAGYRVRTVREPADPVLGRRAQELGSRDPWGSGLLFTVDRLVVRPRIEHLLGKGEVVLQDRSFHSTLAYQGSALPPRAAERLANIQRQFALVPDRVVLVDLRDRTALVRRHHRGRPRSPLESHATQERVARAYRAMARRGRWVVLDGEMSVAELEERADRALRPLLVRRRAKVRRSA